MFPVLGTFHVEHFRPLFVLPGLSEARQDALATAGTMPALRGASLVLDDAAAMRQVTARSGLQVVVFEEADRAINLQHGQRNLMVFGDAMLAHGALQFV